jgi:hypothetical protein
MICPPPGFYAHGAAIQKKADQCPSPLEKETGSSWLALLVFTISFLLNAS